MAKKQVSYHAMLITGFYAAVPVMYFEYFMVRIDAVVILHFTLLMLTIWTICLRH